MQKTIHRWLSLPNILWTILLLSFVLTFWLGSTIAACAWDFTMHGGYESRFSYISRTGQNDLFGNAGIAQSLSGLPVATSIGLSAPFNNVVSPEILSSKGSDGSYQEERLLLYPTLKINPAISLRADIAFQANLNGPYAGGANWADPPNQAGWIRPTSRSESGASAYTSPVLRNLYLTAQIPWGTLRMGRMPLAFGTGWSGFHGNNQATTLLSLSAPVGPLTFTMAHGLHDAGIASDPYDSRNTNMTGLAIPSSTDRNLMRAWNSIYSLRYQDANLDIGTLNRTILYNKIHAKPQPSNTLRDDQKPGNSFPGLFVNASVATNTGGGSGSATNNNVLLPIYGDVFFTEQVFYAKYATPFGSFTRPGLFLNAEYAFQYIMARRQGGRPISGTPRSWMVEGGALAGPAKLSLAAFYRSGHDRNGGTLDIAAPTGAGQPGQNGSAASATGTTQIGDTWNQFIVLGGAHSAIDPYCWLLGYYGTGNNSYDDTGYPTFVDFKAYAARFDYALAANLNLWASYIHARRASNTGTAWGQYTGGLTPAPTRGANVPNDNLGSEIDAGISWKLLENLTLDTKLAYWQPGEWLKHAYVDYSSVNTVKDPMSGVNIQINPGRTIDPIIGMQTGVAVTF